MTQLLFDTVVLCQAIAIAAVLVSLPLPAARIWPPPHRDSWQSYLSWIFGFITLLGPIALGVLDWDRWAVPGWVRITAGCTLVPLGFGVGFWALGRLSFAASFGLKGELVTTGLYSRSRNPQTVAFIIGYLGFGLVSNSELALITAVLAGLELAVLPFSEEPWLRAQFGKPYQDYQSRVPRFFGRRGGGGRPAAEG